MKDWAVKQPRGWTLTRSRSYTTNETARVRIRLKLARAGDADAGGGRALLEVFAARCDTHALIESKKTFTFTVSLAIDGADPVPLDVVPEGGPSRDVLQQALQGCMDGEGAG